MGFRSQSPEPGWALHCPEASAGLRKGHLQKAVYSLARLPVGATLLGPEEAALSRKGTPLLSQQAIPQKETHNHT